MGPRGRVRQGVGSGAVTHRVRFRRGECRRYAGPDSQGLREVSAGAHPTHSPLLIAWAAELQHIYSALRTKPKYKSFTETTT